MKENNFLLLLKRYIETRFETTAGAARHWGIRPQYIDAIMRKERPPTQNMLDELGYERSRHSIVEYTKIKEK